MDVHCFNIDYFPREEYSPDPNDSTMAIPYAVTKSALFFMLATLLLFLGEFFCLFGHFVRHRRIFTFVSGVVCIISGLLMLIGLVMYISIFKAEIGSKLRPRSQLQPPLFTYRYGFSFLLVVGGFMSTEIAGTCAIFLYIYWHQKEWLRKRHEHHRKLSSSSALLDHHHPPFPQCRRHPHHSYYPPPPPPRSPAQPRRLYLDQDPDPGGGIDIHSGEPSPCRHHSRHHLASLTGSMRDVATSASYYSFPAPPPALGVSPCHHHFCEEAPPPPRQHLGGSARELNYFPRDATTNTVSTTADINSCGDIGPQEEEDDEEEDYSPDLHHEHEFVTFDLDDHPPPAPPLDEPSPHPRRKDFAFDTLRRTTPV